MAKAALVKVSKGYVKAVKDAYSALVMYRNLIEDKDPEKAAEIEEVYKTLWCECLNETAPWN